MLPSIEIPRRRRRRWPLWTLVSVILIGLISFLLRFGVWFAPEKPEAAVAVSLVYITQCDRLLGATIQFSDGDTALLSAVSAEVVTRVINEIAPNVPIEKRGWLAMPPPYGGCPSNT